MSMESLAYFSVSEKYISAEQLVAFKSIPPPPVSVTRQDTNIKGPVTKEDINSNVSIKERDDKNNKVISIKRKSTPKRKKQSFGRLLPKEAVAILIEWILSPELFSFPYPTEDEKKI